ncbi:MAG: 50S ribosomal protein L25 [Patescibacteria group bacterium]|nr:50S ribosomal protein L25 [Patescibacteria group bacterium]
MPALSLQADARKVLGKSVNKLRHDGKIPGVLYGSRVKTKPIQLNYQEFEKLYAEAGESSLVDLSIDKSKPVKVIIHSVSRHPLTGKFEHVDFYQVDLKKKITAEIILNFVGESVAVKELGGVLVKSLDRVKVECLPSDLIHEIDIDISRLKTYEDIIHVKDIVVPPGITLLEDVEEPVALVKPPRSEAELEALDQTVEEKVEEVEVVKEAPKEEGEEAEVPEAETKKAESKDEKK